MSLPRSFSLAELLLDIASERTHVPRALLRIHYQQHHTKNQAKNKLMADLQHLEDIGVVRRCGGTHVTILNRDRLEDLAGRTIGFAHTQFPAEARR